MRVFVAGATGVLGRNVVSRLIERGHTVRALVRREAERLRLQRQGAETVMGDLLDRETVLPALAGCGAALHLATAIPRPTLGADWTPNDRVRREGTRNLLDAAQAAGCRRYVQQSITFLYGDHGTRLVDESTPLAPNARISSAADMERMVRESPLNWVILRGGSFYGPGTGPERGEHGWIHQALDGSLRIPAGGSALISLIHVVDMARAVVLATEHTEAAQATFNVVDDHPVSYAHLYRYIAGELDAPAPPTGGPETASLACANAAIKRALGWEPAYPSYRSGLVAALAAARR